MDRQGAPALTDPMRENSPELRLGRRLCPRPHHRQIRPHRLTRALSSSSVSACPHLRAPGASVPDGRTIRQDRGDPSRTSAPPILIPVTNPLERINGEIKRRSDVIGIFPNTDSIQRRIGAVLLEQNDEWQLQHRYMQVEGMAELAVPLAEEPALLATPKAA